MNDIARVRVRTQRPLGVDAYAGNRVTGAFILIDPTSHRTVAAGTLA
jgi:sulfate adenylyltransferase subunit 1 (EFTu-like GTPase family)